MKNRKRVFLPAFLCALLIFTVYVLLDTFVIERRMEVVTEPQNVNAQRGGEAETTVSLPLVASLEEEETVEPVVTENSYYDENIFIEITEERIGDTTVYVADVRLASADHLKTAFADNTYGRNVTDTTSGIAEAVDAILAVNGDFYGAQQSGFVIRGGVLYRSAAKKGAEDLVIYADGSFGIIREAEITAQALLESGARDVLSFGPALIENGKISVSVNDEVGRAKASNPRTAIAMIDELHYLFVVSDGRTNESEGLSLYELAAYLQNKGAQTAYNLDGGGSSTMVFNGRVVNNPTSGRSIKERNVSDIVYVG